jgi:site-specific DNA-methyltransferase (adenine-specific)
VNPYYEDDWVALFHADAREVVGTLAGTCAVYDPPFDKWADVPVAKADTHVCFTSHLHRHRVEAKLGTARAELVWHFADGRWVSHNLPRITHEYILVYGPTGPAYCGEPNTLPERKASRGHVGKHQMPDRVYRPRDRKMLNSVLHHPKNVHAPLGVWSKPPALMVTLLEWATQPGDTVLDLYAGSGTTLVAARSLGRKSIGVEIDEAHCEIAARQLSQGVLDLSAA